MKCLSCEQDRPIAARGLCRTCYSRWQRGGEVAAIAPLAPRTCSVEGCDNRVHSNGLCNKHLLRLRRTGTTTEGRGYTHQQRDPATFRTTHDLYPVWAEFVRTDHPRPVVERWKDFDTFVSEVAPRPGRRFRIYGSNRSAPIGPDNYVWLEASIEKLPDESQKDYARRQRKAHKETNPGWYKQYSLKRSFGADFTFEQYAEMAEAQDNKCAICQQAETEMQRGVLKALCVDHDHTTGKVRGLLCTACNTGLGKFRDDPLILASAIAYLTRHKA